MCRCFHYRFLPLHFACKVKSASEQLSRFWNAFHTLWLPKTSTLSVSILSFDENFCIKLAKNCFIFFFWCILAWTWLRKKTKTPKAIFLEISNLLLPLYFKLGRYKKIRVKFSFISSISFEGFIFFQFSLKFTPSVRFKLSKNFVKLFFFPKVIRLALYFANNSITKARFVSSFH